MKQLDKPVSLQDNLFELNPFLSAMEPYARLTPEQMMYVFVMREPDDRINPFAGFSLDEKQKRFADPPEITEDVEEALEKYPTDFMSTAARALQAEREKVEQRVKFLRKTKLTLDKTEKHTDPRGKHYVINIKGTASQLEAMHKNTETIYKQLAKAEELFAEDTHGTQVHGSYGLTLAEKGEV